MTSGTAGMALIRVTGLTVRYGPVVALDAVSLDIRAGEITGLVGHNGAGKSTLVNALTGSTRPAAGEIRLGGQVLDRTQVGDPHAMARLGDADHPPEPSLAGVLSIADNVTLHAEGERRPRAERIRIAREALAAVGSFLDPERLVSTLDFGERQIVDLARALRGDVKVLLLDEPTAALGQAEAARLHRLLTDLAAQGRAVVYVSHRLRDIVEVCSRVVVLREGRIVMDRPNESLTAADLSEAVSPNAARLVTEERRAPPTRETLLRMGWKGAEYQVDRGEIVGLFGMAGGMQFAVARALYGLGAPDGTLMELSGQRLKPQSPREAMQRGVCYVSADRERESLFHLMSALSNLCMPGLDKFSRAGFLSKGRMREEYRHARGMLDIVGPSMNHSIAMFSGGNRQKHVLGRWLTGTAGARLLVLCQPNQGVDIGARADIARALRRAASDGLTVLVASSEVDEISLLTDRAWMCESDPWVEIPRSDDYERALMEALLRRTHRHAA